MSNRKPLIINNEGYPSELNHPADELTTVNFNADSDIDFTNALDGDEIVIINGKLTKKPRPIIIEKSGWTRTTVDIDTPNLDVNDPNTNVAIRTNITFPEQGLWKPYISFQGIVNSVGANFEATARLGGNSIVKSNPTSAKVIAKEWKDSGGQHEDFPGNTTGAGADNAVPYSLPCLTLDINTTEQLTQEFEMIYGCENNSITASIAEITVEFKRIYHKIDI